MDTATKLPAYRVCLDDGTDYVTSMAAHVTLQMARDYFVGQLFTQEDFETGHETMRTVLRVESA